MTEQELDRLRNPPCTIQLRNNNGSYPPPFYVTHTLLQPEAVLMYEFDGKEYNYTGCFCFDEIESVT
jgi:hypothetical protein